MKDKELKLAVVVEGESMLCRSLINFIQDIEVDVLLLEPACDMSVAPHYLPAYVSIRQHTSAYVSMRAAARNK